MSTGKQAILLGPGSGRRYEMGKVTAIFRADEDETGTAYAVSEWWMEPGFDGVGPHSHKENDEIFHCLAGHPELLVDDEWMAMEPGGFARIPAGITHDFRNPTQARAGLLNVFIPGGFERMMPQIVAWFEENG